MRAALRSSHCWLELGQGDEDPTAATDDAELEKDVLVEVVATHAEYVCRLFQAEREPRPESRRVGAPPTPRARGGGHLERSYLELELLRRHTRHSSIVAYSSR